MILDDGPTQGEVAKLEAQVMNLWPVLQLSMVAGSGGLARLFDVFRR
jgi:hypothetical protein